MTELSSAAPYQRCLDRRLVMVKDDRKEGWALL
jgi:hypothetical protein